ncbi:MAG: glycosyltransferase [Candidatus Omnitrophica bacterium]|nr:glycosyltransferase [Candidatus Omnitrophota bacterium]
MINEKNQKEVFLSLVIPCYNEGKILKKSFDEIIKIFKTIKYKWEIIFVDDKSKDDTLKIINEILSKNPNIKLIKHKKNEGRGKSVKDGISISEGKIIGYIDIDLEVHARYIPAALSEILDGADVVIGNRFYKVNILNFHRFILSRGYNFLVRKILGLPYRDTEAGFKFFKKDKIREIIQRTSNPGWFWDTEIMTYIYQNNLKVVEIPVLFIKKPEKKSTVNVIKDSFLYFINLIKFKKNLRNVENTY